MTSLPAAPETEDSRDVVITRHAYTRARERLSWPRPALERMARRAWDLGVASRRAAGDLQAYLETFECPEGVSGRALYYGGVLYVFIRNGAGPCPVLATVWVPPSRVRRRAGRAQWLRSDGGKRRARPAEAVSEDWAPCV